MVNLPIEHKGRIPDFTDMYNMMFIQMIGKVMSNMKFKVPSNVSDAPPDVVAFYQCTLSGSTFHGLVKKSLYPLNLAIIGGDLYKLE